jgi:hypothetical protein
MEIDMKDLNYDFKQICDRNRDGSFATQADRRNILDLVANQLHEMGFRLMRASSIKTKHIDALVAHWRAQPLSTGTFKNRMAVLRWVAGKLGKSGIVKADNAAYDIGRRSNVATVSKARTLDAGELAKVIDPFVAMSLKLQAAFGLRREESIKIVPAWADRGDHLLLKASWTKGGREREVPIRTTEQRALLADAKALAAGKSLVDPAYRCYRAWLSHFRHACDAAGIQKVHGHRHFYAQQRYRELSGRACPACGGASSKQLSLDQRAIDRKIRLQISNELGHGREQITTVYLGR